MQRAPDPEREDAASHTSGIKSAVRRQFSEVARNYTTSSIHAGGPDLAALISAVPPDAGRILDVGCGTGHTSLAVSRKAGSVVGVDLTEEMLAQGRRLAKERGIENVRFLQGDAEELEFDSASFGVVVSRYSAHHFPNPLRALREIARVLSPGGIFLLVDTVAPDAPAHDTLLNAIELLRDPSHVRDHTRAQWLSMMEAAGLRPALVGSWPLRLAYDPWLSRMNTPPVAAAAIASLIDGAPTESRAALTVEPDRSFTVEVVLLQGQLAPIPRQQ